MVTQGAPESTHAGLVTSSWSSWCLVFLSGDTASCWLREEGLRTAVGVTAGGAELWLCTRSMVAMGTGLDGTGMFSARIWSSRGRQKNYFFLYL